MTAPTTKAGKALLDAINGGTLALWSFDEEGQGYIAEFVASVEAEARADTGELARRIMESLNRHGASYRLPKDPSDLAHLVARDLAR